MASVIQVKEQTTLDLDALRARMREKGVTVGRLAEAAGEHPNNLSVILNGRTYLGEKRLRRLVAAVRALGLDTPDQVAS